MERDEKKNPIVSRLKAGLLCEEEVKLRVKCSVSLGKHELEENEAANPFKCIKLFLPRILPRIICQLPFASILTSVERYVQLSSYTTNNENFKYIQEKLQGRKLVLKGS